MLCLREMSEWITLDNSNEESSWQTLHNHLSSVHLIVCRPLREPEVPRSTPIYISSEDDGEEGQESSDESPHPKPGKFIKTKPSTSAAAQSKRPHQLGVRSQPGPSANSRRDVRSVPKGRRKTPVDEYYSDEDSDRSEYRVMTTDEELDHYAAAGVLDPETADLSGDLDSENDSEQTDVEYTKPSAHSRMTVKTVGAALNRVRKQCRRVTAERDRLTTERKELIAERDHEVKSRRLLQGDLGSILSRGEGSDMATVNTKASTETTAPAPTPTVSPSTPVYNRLADRAHDLL